MDIIVTPAARRPKPHPQRRPHTRLAAIPPTIVVRGVSRGNIPGRRPVKPITFDSAL